MQTVILIFSAISSSVAALSAILAPVITTMMNNNHQLKLKELDSNEGHKRKIIESYISSASEYINNPCSDSSEKYYEYKNLIYFYISKQYWEIVDNIDHAIVISNHSEYDLNYANSQLGLFSKALAEQESK